MDDEYVCVSIDLIGTAGSDLSKQGCDFDLGACSKFEVVVTCLYKELQFQSSIL